MPRIAIPVTQITRSGVLVATPIVGDATDNHTVANNGSVALLVANTGAVTRTLTVPIVTTVDGQAVTSRSYPILAGESKYIGPFDATTYGTTMNVDVDNAELSLSAYRI